MVLSTMFGEHEETRKKIKFTKPFSYLQLDENCFLQSFKDVRVKMSIDARNLIYLYTKWVYVCYPIVLKF